MDHKCPEDCGLVVSGARNRIMGTVFGAATMVSSLGMAFGPWAGGIIFDGFNDYRWLYIGSLRTSKHLGTQALGQASTWERLTNARYAHVPAWPNASSVSCKTSVNFQSPQNPMRTNRVCAST
jgi:MFS family permease